MSDIAPFVFDGQKFRAISVDGQPWFVAADAARILGYSATAALTRTLDDDEKGVQNLHTLGGEQAQTIINTAFGTVPRMKSYRIAGTFDLGMFEYDSTSFSCRLTPRRHFSEPATP